MDPASGPAPRSPSHPPPHAPSTPAPRTQALGLDGLERDLQRVHKLEAQRRLLLHHDAALVASHRLRQRSSQVLQRALALPHALSPPARVDKRFLQVGPREHRVLAHAARAGVPLLVQVRLAAADAQAGILDAGQLQVRDDQLGAVLPHHEHKVAEVNELPVGGFSLLVAEQLHVEGDSLREQVHGDRVLGKRRVEMVVDVRPAPPLIDLQRRQVAAEAMGLVSALEVAVARMDQVQGILPDVRPSSSSHLQERKGCLHRREGMQGRAESRPPPARTRWLNEDRCCRLR
eukprot:765020-Hanusia_phi.AAC.2